MSSNREMIQAFVSGQLSEADHELMAHHISTCQACAAAVAAERAVQVEMTKLSPNPAFLAGSADVLSPSAVPSDDLGAPPVPELQLDFVLDRTAEGAELTLPRDPVREVALDQLPPAPAHSSRRAQRGIESTGAGAKPSPDATERASVAYADDVEIASATAAGVADSVAHAAAVLASSTSWEPLEAKVETAMAVEMSEVLADPDHAPEEQEVVDERGGASVENPTDNDEPEPPASEDRGIPRAIEPTQVEDLTVPGEQDSAPVDVVAVESTGSPVEVVAVAEEPEATPVEVVAVAEEPEATPVEVVAVAEEPEAIPAEVAAVAEELVPPVENAAVVDEPAPSVAETAAPGVSAVEEVAVELPADAEPSLPAPVATPASAPADRRAWRWSAAAALLAVAVVVAYAATQGHSTTTSTTAAASDGLDTASESELEWRSTPSLLTPILDSAVYSRILDVMAVADSLADSLNAEVAYDPFAGEEAARPEVQADEQPVRPARRARIPVRLPQIVSDPPASDAAVARQPGSETLPEVVTGNAPARTTARGGAVVISGVPDVPRLLRTTTHRLRPDVVYVLREYDASAAEPAPRGGVNEYRWKDATGSRLYVLSGPVGVTALRAYARRLQTQVR